MAAGSVKFIIQQLVRIIKAPRKGFRNRMKIHKATKSARAGSFGFLRWVGTSHWLVKSVRWPGDETENFPIKRRGKGGDGWARRASLSRRSCARGKVRREKEERTGREGWNSSRFVELLAERCIGRAYAQENILALPRRGVRARGRGSRR